MPPRRSSPSRTRRPPGSIWSVCCPPVAGSAPPRVRHRSPSSAVSSAPSRRRWRTHAPTPLRWRQRRSSRPRSLPGQDRQAPRRTARGARSTRQPRRQQRCPQGRRLRLHAVRQPQRPDRGARRLPGGSRRQHRRPAPPRVVLMWCPARERYSVTSSHRTVPAGEHHISTE